MKNFKFLYATLALLTLSFSSNGQYYLSLFPNSAFYNSHSLPNPRSLAVDTHGNVYVSDSTWMRRVVKLTPSGGYSVIAGGNYSGAAFAGDGGPATAAGFGIIAGMNFDLKGNLYIADYGNYRIRKIDTNGLITTFAGCSGPVAYADDVPATGAFLNLPVAVACDKWGNVYIAQSGDERIRKVDTNGIIHTITGTGIMGYSGDGGPATNADLEIGTGLTVDTLGNVYITGVNTRKISTDGIISSIAGTGITGYSGDGGPATNAGINTGYLPSQIADYYWSYSYYWYYGNPDCLRGGITADRNGNDYLACSNDGVVQTSSTYDTSARGLIRRIAPDGTISTIAGGGNNSRLTDSSSRITNIQYISPATSLRMGIYGDIQTDAAGNIYYLDKATREVYKLVMNNTAPLFFYGNDLTIELCENSAAFDLNSITSIYDSSGYSEHWAVFVPPAHGTLVCSYSVVSTGALLVPAGISYTPTTGFYGIDSMIISVSNGVSTAYTTLHFVVKPILTSGGITGDSILCQHSLTPARFIEVLPTTRGTWTTIPGSLNPMTTSGDTMYLSPVFAGSGIIQFTNGCGVASMDVTVNPDSGITGPSLVCVGSSISLTAPVSGGTWSTYGTHASITSGGLITGISNGRDSVIYVLSYGSCTLSKPLNVGLVDTFIRDSIFCAGYAISLNPAPSGTWTSSDPSVASVYAYWGSVNFGFPAAGTSTLTLTNVCGSISRAVTVNPVPNDTISMPGTLCTGSTYTLTNSTTGGWWTSTGSNIHIDSSGHLHILYYGETGKVYYTLPGGCFAAANIYVRTSNPLLVADSTNCTGAYFGITVDDSSSYFFYSGYTFSCSASAVTWSSIFYPERTFSIHNLTPGVTTFTYNNYCGTATRTITVYPIPALPSVSPFICSGDSITATDATPGGTWATSYGNLNISAGGLVTTVHGNADNILYILPTGCYNSAPVHISTVSPLPILGNETFCVGEHLNLIDSTPGGTWATSSPAVVSNLMVATSAGTATISYSNGCGTVTKTVTVYPDPAPIGGPDSVCMGSVTTYTDTSSGGVWSVTGSSSITSGGLFSPGATGWDIIYYTLPTGCVYGQVVQVDPAPGSISITSDTYYCGLGLHAGFADSVFSGTWSSSNTVIANPSVSYGNVSIYSASPGQATITYSVTNACGVSTTYKPITIFPAPGNTFFNYTICPGSGVAIYEADSTGIWHIDNSHAALTGPVDLTGSITGVSAGIDTITYTDSNVCGASVLYYIENVPALTVAAPIIGDSIVCFGSTSAYTDASTGGYWDYYYTSTGWFDTWDGVFYTGSVGVATISYSVVGMCSSATATKTITVYPLAGTLTDSFSICEGYDTLIRSILPVGTWSDFNTHALIIHTSDTGATVEAMTPTRDTVNYQISSYCGVANYRHILLIDTYLPLISISGDSVICAGDTATLSADPLSATWSATVPSVAIINAGGLVHAVSPGISVISYTASNACGTVTDSKSLTVYPAATATIVDSANMCVGTTRSLTSAMSGGTWTTFSGHVSISSSSSTGAIISTASAGTDTVYYSITTPCGLAVYKHIVHVSAVVTVNPVSGATTICSGSAVTLSETTTGGVWRSNDTSVATVSSAGVVSGISPGISSITYTVANYCDTVSAHLSVTVDPVPSTPVMDSLDLCTGTTHTFTDPLTGGAWSTAFGLVTIVASTGSATVSGTAAGTDTVYYTVSSSCGDVAYKHLIHLIPTVTVNPVTGATTICLGSAITLSETAAGGVWSSSDTTVARVSSAGIVSGVSLGISPITYTISGYCNTASAHLSITVDPVPSTPVMDSLDLCSGTTHSFLAPVTGGTWSMAFGLVTVVPGTGSATVSSSTAGTDTVYYTVSSSCGDAVYKHFIRVIPVVTVGPVSGALYVCLGSTTILSDATAGGTWSASGVDLTVSTGGIVTGVSVGTGTVTYSFGNACGIATATATITVYPDGYSSIDSQSICTGNFFTYYAFPSGGTWSMSNGNASFVTLGSVSREIVGIAAGRDTLLYTIATICGYIQQIHIIIIDTPTPPEPIIGDSLICASGAMIWTDATPGGSWGSYNPTVASASTGLVTGHSPGIALIYYTVYGVCGAETATKTITVSTSGITMPSDTAICIGSSFSITGIPAGGAWSVSNGDVSWSTSGSSVSVTGVYSGYDTISYTPPSGCVSEYRHVVHIADTSLAPISGDSLLCVGASITLADTATGGVWASTYPLVATINTSGLVTGISGGTTVISYQVVGVCGALTATKTVTVDAVVSYSISGSDTICAGSTMVYTSTGSGGTWSLSSALAVGIEGTLGSFNVTGVTQGIDSILYTNTGPCGTGISVKPVYIAPLPFAGVIVGPDTLCPGGVETMLESSSGGVWSVANGNISISDSGTISFVTPGIDTVEYTATGYCGSSVSKHQVVTLMNPGIAPITGTGTVCTGASISLSDSTTGGTWVNLNPFTALSAILSSDSAVVTGLSAGIDTVFYTRHFYCGTDTARTIITVVSTPVSTPISGPDSVCIGASILLEDTYPGGAWSRSNSNAGISSGSVIGVTVGRDTISYSFANACGSFVSQKVITVLAIPSAGFISGPAGFCIGTTITFTDTTAGGTWSANDTSVAVVDGIVNTGIPGSDTLLYVMTNMCGSDTARKTFTADSVAHVSITARTYVCIGKTDTLVLSPPGGVLNFSNPNVSLLGGGIVQGVSAGWDTIRYSFTNFCGTDTSIYTLDVYTAWKCDSINLVPVIPNGKSGNISIYPNPGTGLYTVSLNQAGSQISVAVTDLLGRKIRYAIYKNLGQFDLDIQNEASGAYFIRVIVDGVTYNGKLIKW